MQCHPQNRLAVSSFAWATLWMLGLAIATSAAGQDYQVDMQLEPGDVVGLDELAVLSIKIASAGGQRKDADPQFELDNFRVAAGPSRSSSLRFVNGVSSRSLTFTWHLQPLAVGTARVHSGVLHIEGETIALPNRQVAVQETAPPGRRRPSRQDPSRDLFSQNDPFESLFEPSRRRRPPQPVAPPKIYLSAEATPHDPYVGEQVLYTLYLFTQADVRSVNPEELPDFKGFWTHVIPQPEQLQPQMLYLDGERIGKVVLLQRALFPRRAGHYEIGPVEARMAALMPDSGPLGSLVPRTREIVRVSGAVVLDVREPPPPPPGYLGAVGQLRIETSLTPIEIQVGEAATLSLTLTGKGHFQGLPAPLLPELAGVDVFPPQQQSNESVKRKSVSGERTWDFVLVPKRPGLWQLPPIEIPYFDPQQERYLSASAPSLQLSVRGSTRLTADSGQTIDLHPIRTAALPAIGGGSPWSGHQGWLFGLPWGLAALAFVVRRRRSSHRAECHRLLEHLAAAAREQRPRRAAAAIEEAWREFLHHRFSLPHGSPSPQWARLLSQRGVSPSAADELVKLADDLHYLRYAPKLSSTDGLRQELVERSRRLARGLG